MRSRGELDAMVVVPKIVDHVCDTTVPVKLQVLLVLGVLRETFMTELRLSYDPIYDIVIHEKPLTTTFSRHRFGLRHPRG